MGPWPLCELLLAKWTNQVTNRLQDLQERDAQSALLKRKTPGQVGYQPYPYRLGVKGSRVQILSSRQKEAPADWKICRGIVVSPDADAAARPRLA